MMTKLNVLPMIQQCKRWEPRSSWAADPAHYLDEFFDSGADVSS